MVISKASLGSPRLLGGGRGAERSPRSPSKVSLRRAVIVIEGPPPRAAAAPPGLLEDGGASEPCAGRPRFQPTRMLLA